MRKLYFYLNKVRSISLKESKDGNEFGYIEIDNTEDNYEKILKISKSNLHNLLFSIIRKCNKGWQNTNISISFYQKFDEKQKEKYPDGKYTFGIFKDKVSEVYIDAPIKISFINNENEYLKNNDLLSYTNKFKRILDNYEYLDKEFERIFSYSLESGYTFVISKYYDENNMEEPIFKFKLFKDNETIDEDVLGKYKDLYEFIAIPDYNEIKEYTIDDDNRFTISKYICDDDNRFTISKYICRELPKTQLPKKPLYIVSNSCNIGVVKNIEEAWDNSEIMREIYKDDLYTDLNNNFIYKDLKQAMSKVESDRLFKIREAEKTLQRLKNPFTYERLYNDYRSSKDSVLSEYDEMVLKDIKSHIK